jgi:hypothetical protein
MHQLDSAACLENTFGCQETVHKVSRFQLMQAWEVLLKKYAIVLAVLTLALWLATGCDAVQFNAFNNVTDTPTRTPRPTFTPRPSATDVPTDTPTLAVTDTPESTDTPAVVAEPTDTPKPVVVRTTRPPTPRPPTKPPAPVFAVHPDFGSPTLCPQDGIYEIVIYIKVDGAAPRPFAGGLYYGVFSGGTILKDGAGKNLIGVTDSIGSLSYGSNCNVSYDRLHPNQSNGKLDVGDVARRGTTQMVLRFIRSATDFTPISADAPIDFGQAGRWWLAFGYRGG